MNGKSIHKSKNLDVFCKVDGKLENPVCPHGPTLLFKSNENGKFKEFFACSAFRNKNDCNFYIEKHKWNKTECSMHFLTQMNVQRIKKIRENAFSLQLEGLSYCHQCNELFNIFSKENLHGNHNVFKKIPEELLETPTKFLTPLSNNKVEAQYFFKDETLHFLSATLHKLKFRKVVCIGVPRLHEHLKKCFGVLHIESILLDLDHRFFYFNSNSEFIYYNMFNNHFFEGQEKEKLFEKFLKISQNESVIVVTDPPFGGRTEPITCTLREISNKFRKINNFFQILPVFWIFPYFMERYIKFEMPEMNMLDYKINYINHNTYNDNIHGRKFGSPVRLFTNIPLSLMELPSCEGYKKCNDCNKWTATENIHCSICNTCPSKNGERYRHCKLCALCVKPNYVHCKNCRRCTQKENHNCKEFQKHVHCWICKKSGHTEIACDKKHPKYRKNILINKEKTERICLICLKHGHNEKNCKRNKFLFI